MQEIIENYERSAQSSERASWVTLGLGAALTPVTTVLAASGDRGTAIATAALATVAGFDTLVLKNAAHNKLRLASEYAGLMHRRRFENSQELQPEGPAAN